MVIKSNGINLKITEGMQFAIESKLKTLNKFLDDNTEISVKITQKKLEVKVVIMLSYNGKLIKITEKDNDFYIALEKVVDTLKTQIKKQHTLKVKRENDQSKTIRTYFLENEEDEADDYFDTSKITKRKSVCLIPMTEEDAIQEMEKLEHNSFIFLNRDNNNSISMLYRRNVGDYGIIENDNK